MGKWDDPTRQTEKSAPLDPCRSERTSGRLCRTWMAPSAQQRYLWNRDLPLRANRDLFCSTVTPLAQYTRAGVGRLVRHSARRREGRATTGDGVFVINRCLLRNGTQPSVATRELASQRSNHDQPGSISVDAKFVNAPVPAQSAHRGSGSFSSVSDGDHARSP